MPTGEKSDEKSDERRSGSKLAIDAEYMRQSI